MADRSRIEWTDATWNPVRARNRETGAVGWYCVHTSDGCRGCYAEALNRRWGTRIDYKAQLAGQVEVFLDDEMLLQPMRWRRPRAIFPCSMTDLFGEFVPDWMIDVVFAVMALCERHTFMVLTKRGERMRRYFDGEPETRWPLAMGLLSGQDPNIVTTPGKALPNVWLGVSAEDQRNADARVPDLMATPAAFRFVSAEPLLGAVDLRAAALDWVIVGGESGLSARPMHPAWARSIRDQCAAAGVAFHFKQWGEWAEVADVGDAQPFRDLLLSPEGHISGGALPRRGSGSVWMRRIGKRTAGRLLDGVEHNARPLAEADA